MTPSLRDDPGQVHLGDRLDDSGAADAGDAARSGRLGEAGLVRPEIAADHLVARLQRRAVDAHALDRAGRGALAAGNLRALEGRAGRRRAGEQAISIAQHDLGVGADVDEQRQFVAQIGALGERPCPRRRRRHGRRCRAGRRRRRRGRWRGRVRRRAPRSRRRASARRARRRARSDRAREKDGA